MTEASNDASAASVALNAEVHALINSQQSLQLASINPQQDLDISYTPFIVDGEHVYIYVSLLSKHTQNLLDTGKLSILFVEDESKCKNIFARRRAAFQCLAKPIERDTKAWTRLMDQFESERGKTVSLLRTLKDFHLFQLSCLSGSFVKGFGQAYQLDGLSTIEAKQVKP